jgi:septum formation protein
MLTDTYKLILASASPRRHELLSGLELPFTVRVLPDVDESYPAELEGAQIPLYIATRKAEAYRTNLSDDELVITADTIVWLDSEVLGKPDDADAAVRMLRRLSGRTHQVYTGVCLTTPQWQRTFTARTDVTFARLTEEQIDHYVRRYAPLDKAGAYGIQEWIGYVGVERIEGSYFNVMGLPVQRLYQELLGS